MRKLLLILLLASGLLLASCGSEETKDDGAVLPQFYSALGGWIDGRGGQPACDMIAKGELEKAAAYAKTLTDGDLCEAVLQENFSFLLDEEKFKLLSVRTVDEPEKVSQQEGEVWAQPVEMNLVVDGKKKKSLARAAAVIEGGKIKSLAGLRLSTVVPEEFASSLGAEDVVRVDPVSAAYFSTKE